MPLVLNSINRPFIPGPVAPHFSLPDQMHLTSPPLLYATGEIVVGGIERIYHSQMFGQVLN